MPRGAASRTRARLPTKKHAPISKRCLPKAMTYDSDSDDAFKCSPVPKKKRRLNPKAVNEDDEEGARIPQKDKRRGRSKALGSDDETEWPKAATKTAKIKNHVHVPQSHALLEDQFCTQEPELGSSPYRLRGPIWRKIVQLSPGRSVKPIQQKPQQEPQQKPVLQKSPVSHDIPQSSDGGVYFTNTPQNDDNTPDGHASELSDHDHDALEAMLELDSNTLESSPKRRLVAPKIISIDPSKAKGAPPSPDSSDDDPAFEALGDIKIRSDRHPSSKRTDNADQQLVPCTAQARSVRNEDNLQENQSTMAQKSRHALMNKESEHPMDISNQDTPNSTQDAADFDAAQELADLPSDAFASSSSSPQKSPTKQQGDQRQQEQEAILLSSQVSSSTRPNLAAPTTGLRQITLFGLPTQQLGAASQSNKKHNWPLVNRNEPPTHHKLNHEALKTYTYPTNLGSIRDYQYNIVARGLYNNLLVALPTGLGKTFIAATIMLNWFRWTADAQIVFVAPTKPLVAQQVEACFGIAGIPRSQTSLLTGGISPGLRAEEWKNKRVFFMTPQTIVNDLKTGIADPKRIVLLVVDEAHRATGGYAYVEVVKFIRRFNQSFRMLALTATPGSSVESVQEVIDGLEIARVEIRTEVSLDIRQYVHARPTDVIVLDYSPEMEMIMGMFASALQPVLSKLNQFNAYWTKDPMALTAYGLTLARQKWMGSNAGRNANAAVKGMLNRIFSVLSQLAHSIELLKFHGITPFFDKMKQFRSTQEGSKGGKYEREILDSENFQKMMTRLQFWCTNPEFVGHPKLELLQSRVLNHFLDAGEAREVIEGVQPRPTRIMIFAHYRDSAEQIVKVLERNRPTVRPHVFIGQAAAKGSEGMDQKRQQQIISEFKEGKHNTLVATSIGEEGLDIGEVDLIICYDSSASPIRMLQRMGRTGRKRAGRILLLLMRGKEEQSFTQAKDNYEKMQTMIAEGKRFRFHDERSPRIVPWDVQPEVDKRVVEIPQENNDAALPEPNKKGRAPKRPPKKFHMPDGVRTGFVRASRMDGDVEDDNDNDTILKSKRGRPSKIVNNTETPPTLDEVILTPAQMKEFERRYLNVTAAANEDLIDLPRKDAYPALQRSLRPVKYVQHGSASKALVKTLERMHNVSDSRIKRLEQLSKYYDVDDLCDEPSLVTDPASRIAENSTRQMTKSVKAAATKTPRPRGRPRKTDPPVETEGKRKPAGKGRPGRPRKETTFARDEDAMEAASSSPPLTDPRMRLPSQGIALGSEDTEREDEDEGYDMDSELADFINDDDEDEQDATQLDSSLSLPQPTKRAAPQRSLQRIFSSEPASESISEDDAIIEDLDDLSSKRRHAQQGVEDAQAPLSMSKRTTSPLKRKRKVIEDSSD